MTLMVGLAVLFVLSFIPMVWVALFARRRFQGTRVVT